MNGYAGYITAAYAVAFIALLANIWAMRRLRMRAGRALKQWRQSL